MELKDNTRKHEFAEKVIYKKQFKGDNYKLIYHIVNSFYKLLDGNRQVLAKILLKYVQDSNANIKKITTEVFSKYDRSQSQLVCYNCFSHIKDILTEEDLAFSHAGKKRFIQLNEIKFILYRITKHLVDTSGCRSILTNNYFLESGFRNTYKEKTMKSLSAHKLAQILQVLAKIQYLYITYNTKSQRVVQIGPNNPYYLLSCVPNLDEQEMASNSGRKFDLLKSEKAALQSALTVIRKELDDANKKIEQLEQELNSYQSKYDDLVEMVLEKEKTIEELTRKENISNTDDNNYYENKNCELNRQLIAAEEQINNMVSKQEYETLKAELDNADIKIQSMEKQINDVTVSHKQESSDSKIKQLEEKNELLMDMLVEKEAEIEQLKAQGQSV